MRKVEDELQAAGATTPEKRTRALRRRARARGARRRGRDLRGPRRRHDRLAAARRQRLRLRPDVPAGRPFAYLRRDERGGKARLEPGATVRCRTARAPSQLSPGASWASADERRDPRAGERDRASASMCTGRSARPSAPIATSTATSAISRRTRRASPPRSRASFRISPALDARARRSPRSSSAAARRR